MKSSEKDDPESLAKLSQLKRKHEDISKKLANDARDMTMGELFGAICGDQKVTKADMLYDNVNLIKKEPTINQFVIANPKAFLDQPDIAKKYGVDFTLVKPGEKIDLTLLARMLPVIYVADWHKDYGSLGLQLNNLSPFSMNEFYPSLRAFRTRPVYKGGAEQKGAAFLMVHSKVGFPENRPWRTLPSSPSFRLFHSPDVAMANELCLTNDAQPTDFKFFQHTTVWQPNQLETEWKRRLWLTIDGPAKIIFDDDEPDVCPLYKRILCSLPSSFVQFSAPARKDTVPSSYTPKSSTFSLFDDDLFLDDDDELFDSAGSDVDLSDED
eukprot:gene31937-38613_t